VIRRFKEKGRAHGREVDLDGGGRDYASLYLIGYDRGRVRKNGNLVMIKKEKWREGQKGRAFNPSRAAEPGFEKSLSWQQGKSLEGACLSLMGS